MSKGKFEMTRSISWTSLRVGDILIDQDRVERRVLARLGDLIAVHDGIADGRIDLEWFHVDGLEKRRWTIKDAEADSLTELSVSELEKRLDIPTGTLRVKKD